MSKVAVIVNCYNAFPVMHQCLDALFAKSSPDVSVILVDQHSPDEKTRDYLIPAAKAALPRHVIVLDPGRNLGCHHGFNYGFEHGVLGKGFDFSTKLDDDTVIQTPDWDRWMVRGLEARPDIACLSADIDAKQSAQWDVETVEQSHFLNGGRFVYDVAPPNAVVGFSCVMFRVADILKWEGKPNKGYSGRVWLDNPQGDGRLYGGEELYMARKVRAEGRKIAHFKNVFVHHLGNEQRDPDYVLWKLVYGFYGWTAKPMDEWLKSGEMLRDLRKLVGAWACGQEGAAKPYIVDCVRRIGDIGDAADAAKLLLLAHGDPFGLIPFPRKDMPEVTKELEKSAARLTENFGKKAR